MMRRPEPHAELGVLAAQHERVADALDLLGAVRREQRRDAVAQLAGHLGGAVVARGRRPGR